MIGENLMVQSQLSGDMMHNWAGGGMMGGFGILSTLLALGLVVLVWLWVVKLWREVFGKNHKH